MMTEFDPNKISKKHGYFKNAATIRIIGVDPGTAITGYGIIDLLANGYVAIDFGCIRPPSKYKLGDRYALIFDSIVELIEKFKPHELAVETQYVDKNVQSALKIGMARASVIIPAKKAQLEVFEYSPTRTKKAVVGTGKASKAQVQGMIQRLLNLPHPPQPEDAADALALALCHAHARNVPNLIGLAL